MNISHLATVSSLLLLLEPTMMVSMMDHVPELFQHHDQTNYSNHLVRINKIMIIDLLLGSQRVIKIVVVTDGDLITMATLHMLVIQFTTSQHRKAVGTLMR